MNEEKRIADFLFEIGTMRKLIRIHRQTLLTDDTSDNIASHSYRVSLIGWFLAKMENADPYKTVMMCLIHDLAEVRSGDHNHIHKRYVRVFDEEINEEQLGTLPYQDLKKLIDEYSERKSKESILAKDADLLDQVLLLKEYEWQGNKEAAAWLHGKNNEKENNQLKRIVSKSAKKLGETIYGQIPSGWWEDLHTFENRKS
ncbi:MAG: HD domain-containing protein [Minisyncoccia bacterium]